MTPKIRRFVAEYLIDQNGTQAAIRAGYSPKTAQEQASQLLSKLMVKRLVEEGLQRIEQKSDVTVEKLRRNLADMAEADPLEAFNSDGTLKPLSDIPKPVRMLLAGIEIDGARGELTKLRFSDRTRIVELLGKHLRMFADLHEVTGKGGKPFQPVSLNIDLSKFDDKTVLKLAGMDAA